MEETATSCSSGGGVETVWDDPHALVTRSRVGTRARTTRGAVLCVNWHTDNCSNKDAGTTVTSHEDRQQEEEREEKKRNSTRTHGRATIWDTSSMAPANSNPKKKKPTKPAAHDRAGQALRGQKKEDLSAERVLTHQKRWSFLLRVGFDVLL